MRAEIWDGEGWDSALTVSGSRPLIVLVLSPAAHRAFRRSLKPQR